jgi:hypothetical protein
MGERGTCVNTIIVDVLLSFTCIRARHVVNTAFGKNEGKEVA